MRSLQAASSTLVSCLVVVVSGCGGGVRAPVADPIDIQARAGRTALNSETIGDDTVQVLRLHLVDAEAGSDPEAAVRVLAARLQEAAGGPPALPIVNALAELALLEGRRLADDDPSRALGLFLCGATHTYEALRALLLPGALTGRDRLDPRPVFTAELYNASVARIASLLNRDAADAGPWHVDGPDRRYRLSWDLPSDFPWPPSSYELRPADQIDVRGLANHYRLPGLGAPVVARLRDMPERVAAHGGVSESYRRFRGLTAVLETTSGDTDPVDARIRLLDPDHGTVDIAGTAVAIAADLSAPLAVAIDEMNPEQYGETGMLRAESHLDLSGLYVLAPYRRDKIPVVLVHGLGATAGTFAEMANDIIGDPELRDRYQLWFFNYPSGLTFGYSSVLLRRALDEARSTFDPDHNDPNMDRIVVLAHSMGGLMTRLLVTADRSNLYDAFFTEPLDSLQLEPEDAEIMRESFASGPTPYVERVVFMATPHRGSPMAAGLLGKAGAAISGTPDELRERLERVVEANPDAVTPAAEAFTSDSIATLAPETPLLEALSSSPMAADVVIHSILGHGRGGDPGPGSSDGVVPYWSAHLDGSVSELSVPSNHIVHDDPRAIAEVKRILLEHLGSETTLLAE